MEGEAGRDSRVALARVLDPGGLPDDGTTGLDSDGHLGEHARHGLVVDDGGSERLA